MIEGKKSVALSYQFIGEAILFFLLGYPLLNNFITGNTLRTYMVVVLIGLFVYFFLRYWDKGYIPFLSVFLVSLGLALLLNKNLIVIAIIGLFLVWRLYVHEQDPDLNNEQFLLIFSTIVSFIMLIFFREMELIIALLFLYTTIWVGNALSHYLKVDSTKRRGALKSLIIIWFLLIGGGGVILGILPFLRTAVGTLWTAISYGFMTGVNGLLSLLARIGLDVSKIEPVDKSVFPRQEDTSEENTLDQEALDGYAPEKAQQVADSIETGAIVLFVIVTPLILFIIYRLRKRLKPNIEKEEEQLSYQHFSHDNKKQGLALPSLRFQRSNSEGEVRRHFHSFERFAARQGHGRLVQESLEEWFERIGLDVKLTHLYQEVRYGNKSLGSEEKKQFYSEMRRIKRQIIRKEK